MSSYVEDDAVIFARRGDEYKETQAARFPTRARTPTDQLRKFKIVMGSGAGDSRFLLINSTPA